MPGVFSRGRGSRVPKANPMAGKLAGVIPALTTPEVEPVVPVEPDSVDLAGQVDDARDADRRPARSAATGLAAAAPAEVHAPSVFALPAGYNLPSPGPFARNRQRVGRAFGEVVVTEGTVLLRLRRRRVGRLIPPITVLPEDISLVSPTESDFMGNNRGVVLERVDGEHLYVWVQEPTPLLTVLSIHGFPVSDQPVPVTRAG
jgi:hypothetical protein